MIWNANSRNAKERKINLCRRFQFSTQKLALPENYVNCFEICRSVLVLSNSYLKKLILKAQGAKILAKTAT